MCRKLRIHSSNNPIPFFPSVWPVTTLVPDSFFSLPISFFIYYACWSLCMWSTSGFIPLFHFLQTPSHTVTLLYFFLGKPLHSYSKTPLVALNSGGQPVSCSIMVLSLDHLPQPHPRSSGWGPDEVGLPCPILVMYSCVQRHVAIMCSWEYSCFLVMLRLFV